MGFKPDVQQPAAVGRFRPDASAGAEDILGDARMSELSQNPAAPLKGAVEEKPSYIQSLANAGAHAQDAAGKNPGMVIPGMAEAGMNAVSSGLSVFPGSLDVLLGRAGWSDPQNPTNDLATAKNKYVYEPRSDYGAAASEQLAALTQPLGEYVFGPISDYSGAAVHAITGSEQAGNDASASIPDLLGLGLGSRGGKVTKSLKTPKPVVESTAVPEGRATVQNIRQQGIKLTPKEASEITGDKNYVGRALQAIGGDAKVTKDMAAKNKPVLNDMASKAVGADSLTEAGLKTGERSGQCGL
jgi:hypothetical protein